MFLLSPELPLPVFSGGGMRLIALGRGQDVEELSALEAFHIPGLAQVSLGALGTLHLGCTLRESGIWAHNDDSKDEQVSPKRLAQFW